MSSIDEAAKAAAAELWTAHLTGRHSTSSLDAAIVDRAAAIIARHMSALAGQQERIAELESAIRKHRDYRGDDRCWQDDEELYAVLPEVYAPPARDTAVELGNCQRFIACRHNPATEYISPQRRIEELEHELAALRQECERLNQPTWPEVALAFKVLRCFKLASPAYAQAANDVMNEIPSAFSEQLQDRPVCFLPTVN